MLELKKMGEKISKKFECLEKGDLILFNNRQQPLEVTYVSEERDFIGVKGPRGGKYSLIQNKHNPDLVGLTKNGQINPDGGWIEGLQVVENV